MTLRHADTASTMRRSAAALVAVLALIWQADDALGAPTAALAPATGPAGTNVTINGAGFPARARVHIRAGATKVATAATDRGGRFSAGITVPAMSKTMLSLVAQAGRARVVNRFERGATAPEWREWASSTGRRVRWTAGPLAAGETLHLRAAGLKKRERLTLTGLGQAKRLRADRKGTLALAIGVPEGAAGQRNAVLKGPGGKVNLAFTVKAPAPFAPTPPPFSPQPAPPSPTDPVPTGGTLVVRQLTAPADGTRFAFSGPGGFDLGHGETRSFPLAKGSYLLRQTAVPGYDLTALACDDTDSTVVRDEARVNAVIGEGETVTCTFSNTKRGKGVISQRTTGEDEGFTFRGVGVPFSLRDNEQKELDLPAGSHTVTQEPKVGYDLTGLSCTESATTNSLVTLAARTVTAIVDPGETVQCTFTNTERGTLRIVQKTLPGGGNGFTFGGAGTLTLSDGQSGDLVLPAGTQAITQAVRSGYDLTALECDDGTGDTATSIVERKVTANLAPGELVTCTFTNTQRAKLNIRQTTVPAAPEKFGFTGAGAFELADGETRSLEVPAGPVSVAQSARAGYDLRTLTCSGAPLAADQAGRSVTGTLAPGAEATCTFTNAKRAAITVQQLTLPAAADEFTFTGPDGEFGLVHGGQRVLDVAPGTYTIAQKPEPGYDLTSIRCGDTSHAPELGSATFEIAPGGSVSCEFTNTKHGKLTVVQTTVPGGPDAFQFTSPATFHLANGQSTTLDRPAGRHAIKQESLARYDLTALDCTESVTANSLTDPAKREATAVIDPGETVTCTFTNTKRAKLDIKQVTLPAGAEPFSFTGAAEFELSHQDPPRSLDLRAGSYTVTQGAKAGYDLRDLTCTGGTATVDAATRTITAELKPGDDVACVFTNAQRGTLEIDQVTLPSSDRKFAFNGAKTFALADGDAVERIEVPAGPHHIVQTPVEGFDLSVVCGDGDAATPAGGRADVDVAPGATVRCTFTNTERAALTITQKTVPGGPEQFQYTGAGDLRLADGGVEVLDLSGGRTVTLAQTPEPGYDLSELTCTDDASITVDRLAGTATFVLDHGDRFTCTFTNTKRATIQVRQATTPETADRFTYRGPAGEFSLAHGEMPHTLEVPPGSYPIVQAAALGYELTAISCPNAGSTTDLDSRTANAVVQAGETLTCTFTDVKHGKLQIEQRTSDPPPSDQSGYTSPSASFGDFELADDAVKDLELRAGTHKIRQARAPDGYPLTAIMCGEKDTVDLAAAEATVEVPAGGVAKCTFTNSRPTTGTIVVRQETLPGSADVFDFTGPQPFSLADGGSTSLTVPAGSPVEIRQTARAGYVLTGVSCATDGAPTNPVTVTVTAGETVECTFTSSRRGRILIDKVTDVPTEDTFRFIGPSTTQPPSAPRVGESTFSLRDAWAPQAFEVDPGTHFVRERSRTGWRLYAIDCDDAGGDSFGAIGSLNTATLKVAPGETVLCRFRSRPRGTVVLDVATDPPDSPERFRFSTTSTDNVFNDLLDATLRDKDEPLRFFVNPGSYSISETDAWGWALTSISCEETNPTGASSSAGRTATFNVQEGDVVTCMFHNQKQARITIEQQTDPGDTSVQETAFAYSGLGIPTLRDDDVHRVAVGGGPQTVTQQAVPGYALGSIRCESDRTGSFTIDEATATVELNPVLGDSIHCLFTNVRDQPAGPIRAAFYEPSAAAVTSAAYAIETMQFGGVDAGLVTWRGQQDESDSQFKTLLDTTAAARSGFRWAPVYAPERTGDPSIADIGSDLARLAARAESRAHLDRGSRFVVFVPTSSSDDCATADRWEQAAAGANTYVVLQAFAGHESCPASAAPDDWYATDPGQPVTRLAGSSFAISPLARDLDQWAQSVASMVASHERWQLITSYNDAAAGTHVEPDARTQSAVYGHYVDALHADGAPVVAGAGDIACDPTHPEFANGVRDDDDTCRQDWVSDVLLPESQRLHAVLALGDIQYEESVFETYFESYHPSWGRVKDKTRPAVGNHEYETPNATGYFAYFNGDAHQHGPAGDPARGYYDYHVGDDWHVVVLNSNCSEADLEAGMGCAQGSAQAAWLDSVLTDPARQRQCTLAYAHHPRFGSGEHGGTDGLQPLWDILARRGVDVYLAGHNHGYERFAPMDESGQPDRATGVRSFVVGTGGRSWRSIETVAANSEHQGAYEVFGVLDLALKPGGYSWDFIPDANPGGPPLDNGADRCH